MFPWHYSKLLDFLIIIQKETQNSIGIQQFFQSYRGLSPLSQNQFARIFQTGWFLESLWTQVLILLLLRTKKIPFVQSRPSKLFQIVTVLGILIFTSLIYTPLGNFVGLYSLPPQYYIFLFAVAASYLGLMTVAKKIYIKKNKTLY